MSLRGQLREDDGSIVIWALLYDAINSSGPDEKYDRVEENERALVLLQSLRKRVQGVRIYK